MCLSDFIRPENDWIGGFAVTAGHGVDEHVLRFKADNDDYSAILVKALADRLAEAFAERMHQHVRTTLWGYAEGEQLTNEALIREQYRRSEEHTSELQSLMRISYAVFCLKKKN